MYQGSVVDRAPVVQPSARSQLRPERAMEKKRPVDPQERKALSGAGGVGRDIWPF
jgi:hypothetical protein